MLIEKVDYEGVIHGVSDMAFRKISRLLRNAFAEVEYQYEGLSGSILLRGPSAMFDEDPENKIAIMDLIASLIQPGGKGVIIEKKWTASGRLKLDGYQFKDQSWEPGCVEF